MSDQTRELPEQPNLRFLKLQAKRRLAAGEFATLHDAQLAVAREHGLSSWTVLKETVTVGQPEPNPALAQVRWLTSRFRDAGAAAWARPAAEELREHFTGEFLSLVPPDTIIDTTIKAASMFHEDLVVIDEPTDRSVRTQLSGVRIEAVTEADPPHRLISLQLYRLSQLVTDERVAAPPTATAGQVPAEAMATARETFAGLGLPGLIMAGAGGVVAGTAVEGDAAWSLALGWANLERPEPLGVRHQFPAYAITQVITATVALRLVAEGLVELDAPANQYLRTVRLADEEVTVRELLSHTGGVDNGVANPQSLFGSVIMDLISLVGPVMPCSGPRGSTRYSVGGYAMLGQLIADVTGARYEDTAESLVLRPLGLADSSFPASWPERGSMTGYQLDDAGRFEPVPGQVCVNLAAGGLWSTAADLARFGAAWGSLLPADLSAEALRPQAPDGNPGPGFGFGWPLHPGGDLAGLVGGALGVTASLLIEPGSGRASVVMASRLIPTAIEQVNGRLLRPDA
ncbi:MAG: serine hydrolase domain-containing protein [Trebonia sp.]